MNDPLQPDEAAAMARMALDELMRRHPEWDVNPPCPDCGSFLHFECNGDVVAHTATRMVDRIVYEPIKRDDFYAPIDPEAPAPAPARPPSESR